MCSGAAQLRGALEHRQVSDGLGDFGDRLDRGGAGADDGDALAGEIDPFLRPEMRVARLALKGFDAGDAGIVAADSTPIAVIKKRVV